MLNKQTEKLIKNHKYSVTHLFADNHWNFATEFTAMVGTSYPKLCELMPKNITDFKSFLESNIDLPKVGEIVRDVLTSLYVNDKNGEYLYKFLSQTFRDGVNLGNRNAFNAAFSSNMSELIQALFFTMQVHIGNFFFEEDCGSQTEIDQ